MAMRCPPRQKNRKDLAWFARRATTWILEKAKERRVVKGQRLYEILQDEASRQVCTRLPLG